MDSDGDAAQTPSNVTRIARCIKPTGIDKLNNNTPIPQVIYYQAGVGTGDVYSRVVGGATGKGLAEHIREAYGFACLNYHPGDEIFIIGFSRGAFTARSVASFIRDIGLLTVKGLASFYQIFEDWEYQLKPGWKTRFPNDPWPNRVSAADPAYGRKLVDLELTRADIPIKCVAVWETVGSLGVPVVGFLPQPPSADFSFVNTKVEPNIEYAFQALALDERRRSFIPTIWEKPDGQDWPRLLKQTWFAGVHSDVGGSYPDTDLANLTLAWMISQLETLLDFDQGYVVRQFREAMERQRRQGLAVRPWGMGEIHDSMTFFFRLGGAVTRTPDEYLEINPVTLQRTDQLLKNTNEHVHSSVRVRMGQKDTGYGEKGYYNPNALKGWDRQGQEVSGAASGVDQMKDVVWEKKSPKADGKVLRMPEDQLGELERTIMEIWPEIAQESDSVQPSTGQ